MLFEKLRTMICEEFELSEDEVTPNVSFAEIGMDSLDMVDLVMSIEDEFCVEVTDEALEGFRTVADVVKFLESVL
ncbi:MAG: acyl carrier protein [Clostridia bacterium]|nr:acyl carrier protein [Clostridia bacterium]